MNTGDRALKHIEEHRLEIFVLSGGMEADAGEIADHLAQCHGCRELAVRIRLYYEEAERLLRERSPEAVEAGEALVRADRHVQTWRRPERPVPYRPLPGLLQKLRTLVQVHPAATAGGSLAFIGALALLANGVFADRTPTLNPRYVSFSPGTGIVRIHAQTDSVVWEKPAAQVSQPGFLSGISASSKFAFRDLDGDGINEIITGFTFDGDEEDASTEIRVFDTRKQLIDVRPLNRPVPYEGRAYAPVFRAQGIVAGDLSGPGTGGFLASAVHLQSPACVIRYDRSLKTEGVYWHFGPLGPSLLTDLDGDGVPEYLVGGQNDVADASGELFPVLVVLEPASMTGERRTSTCAAYTVPVSRAERWYLRFPWSDLDSLEGREPSVEDISDGRNGTVTVTLSNGQAGRRRHRFYYVFSTAMELREVRPAAEAQRMYALLRKGEKVHQAMDEAYCRRLKEGVRYWNGAAWQAGAARVTTGEPLRRMPTAAVPDPS
jgi:hypothetical protein